MLIVYRVILVFGITLILSSCQSIPYHSPSNSDWVAEGKVNVKSDDNYTGTFYWQQTKDHYEVNVSGPFGLGATSLVGNYHLIKITNNNGTFIGNPNQLLQTQLGWRVPIESLPYWLRGHPAPNQKSTVREDGDTRVIEQTGWRIELSRFKIVENHSLPHRVLLINEQARITFLIYNWTS